ncbi:hypothetical protein BGX34_001080 [Mortierella sp. NVP85]|nr:hypothetical protein BGX34_001080 [Mortierella sp. NVP85]
MASRVPIQQDRSLLNPKFEGYKLSFLEESRLHFLSIGTPGPGITVSKLSSTTKLSYRQIQSRIRHNHLHPGWNSFKPVSGDSSTVRDGVLFASAHRLRSYRLLQLPAPAAPLNFYLEFPSVKPISPDFLLVSDGASTFYLIRLVFKGLEYSANVEAVTRLQPFGSSSSNEFIPCGLLEAKAFNITTNNNDQAMEVKFVVYHTSQDEFYSTEPSPHHKSDRKTVFIVSLYSIVWNCPPSGSASASTMDMDVEQTPREPVLVPARIVHSIRGTDIPFYCALDPSNEGYVIGSNSTFKPTREPVVDQTTRFLEPGSEAMELDGTDVGVSPAPEPPYIWTQTDTEVTLCFSLPKGTTKHAVNCKFSRQGVQLQINLPQPASPGARLPHLDNMPLFDEVQSEDCFWTLESATGVLTLSLEKNHAKTRWPQVFAEGIDTNPVEETLDPSVFAEYKSALERYTTDQANAGPGRDSTLLPSLAQDPQEDIDEEGEEVKFSWIQAEDGADIVRASTIGSGHDWIGQAFPSFESSQSTEQPFRMPSVCLKHDVDGLVFAIQHVPGSVPSNSSIQQAGGIMKFVHVSTFDALAFVQASKREKRFVMHDPHGRFAVIVESSRNVYIYYHTEDSKLRQERQIVVDVSKGQQVDIIGCQLVSDGVLVILMEGKNGVLVIDLHQA